MGKISRLRLKGFVTHRNSQKHGVEPQELAVLLGQHPCSSFQDDSDSRSKGKKKKES